MMKNFMVSGSLIRGMELDEVPDESNTMPFSGEAAVMMVYGGRPPLGRHHVSNWSPRTPTHCDWGHKDSGM
jgi:hypothetical protein